jgi:hypothetical protein
MNPSQEPDKRELRVVSKGRYLCHVVTKFLLRGTGCCLIMGTVVVGMFAVFIAVDHFYPRLVYNEVTDASQAAMIGGLAVFAVIVLPLLWVFYRLFVKASQMEPVVPLTRANTAGLPAPESLVRASQEPAQEQQAVLLRAATQTQERHEEQLLRAARRLDKP